MLGNNQSAACFTGDGLSARTDFTKPFTQQEPIPATAIEHTVEIMRSGRLHRYNLAVGDSNEASRLEREYVEWQRVDYCGTCASGGHSIPSPTLLKRRSAGFCHHGGGQRRNRG